MNIYKKISIMLFVIMLVMGIKVVTLSQEVKELEESKNTEISTENDETNPKKEGNEINNSNAPKDETKNIKTIVKDTTSNIEGLSEEDNKEVRETVVKFLKGYAHYLDSENLSFENRMQKRVYDFKDIMTKDIYENTRLAVEGECMNLGDNFIYKYLRGINIYEAKKENDKVYINIGTKSIFFDFTMNIEPTNERNGDTLIDYKFTLVKDNGVWKIDKFVESYK